MQLENIIVGDQAFLLESRVRQVLHLGPGKCTANMCRGITEPDLEALMFVCSGVVYLGIPFVYIGLFRQ